MSQTLTYPLGGTASSNSNLNITPSTGLWATGGYGGNITITPGLTGSYTFGNYNYAPYSPVEQSVIFEMDEKLEKDASTLKERFLDIIDNEFIFYPQINGKRLEPLETIMKFIKLKQKFDVELSRCGYNIVIKGVLFKNLSNILSKESDTKLKVSFEYDELVYDNTLLSIEEKRGIKVKELMKKIQ